MPWEMRRTRSWMIYMMIEKMTMAKKLKWQRRYSSEEVDTLE